MNPLYVSPLKESIRLKELGCKQVSEWYWEQ